MSRPNDLLYEFAGYLSARATLPPTRGEAYPWHALVEEFLTTRRAYPASDYEPFAFGLGGRCRACHNIAQRAPDGRCEACVRAGRPIVVPDA